MREFFRGWRRRAGVAALVMACAFAGMWLRSRVIVDTLIYRPETLACHSLTCSSNGIEYIRGDNFPVKEREPPCWCLDWKSEARNPRYAPYWGYELLLDEFSYGFRWQVYEFRDVLISEGSGLALNPPRIDICVIPWWAVMLPLILLSAYLILIPSRKQPRMVSQPHA
jgi:hypothetical protein